MIFCLLQLKLANLSGTISAKLSGSISLSSSKSFPPSSEICDGSSCNDETNGSIGGRRRLISVLLEVPSMLSTSSTTI
ncbi:hypothetical protein V1477_008744 [Vespula maculifrons]|uniref:Secreted protein n=1 Tax=Vespula maculifrons TaxID=7453 RepID=A0ABD2CDX3_VESMC